MLKPNRVAHLRQAKVQPAPLFVTALFKTEVKLNEKPDLRVAPFRRPTRADEESASCIHASAVMLASTALPWFGWDTQPCPGQNAGFC